MATKDGARPGVKPYDGAMFRRKGPQRGMLADAKRALMLPGGGARAAYQIGVLKAVAELVPPRAGNPFQVISGTSAGAINAAVLGARVTHFHHAVAVMERRWSEFRAEHVYRTDLLSMFKSALTWTVALTVGGMGGRRPHSLLDNTPLRNLLGREIRFSRLRRAISQGHLDALAITTSAYGSARSVTFFEGREDIQPWSRVRRAGVRTELTLDHVMASSAVPLVFPPVLIRGQWYGDGAVRQPAPLSAAVHLGADRVLVIGGRHESPDPEPVESERPRYPSFGELAGYMLDSLFLDSLYADLERLTRINQTLEQLPAGTHLSGAPGQLRRVEALIITPSRDIREIAQEHLRELPRTVRLMLRGMGATRGSGLQLMSYLLFESGYTRALIRLGYDDAMAMREDMETFLFAESMDSLDAPEPLRRGLLLQDEEDEPPQAEVKVEG